MPCSRRVEQIGTTPRGALLAGALSLLCAFTSPAVAQQPPSAARQASPRVIVTAPSDASPLLKESLVRAQGELSAVGLSAELELTPPNGAPGGRIRAGVYGSLELEQRGQTLLIVARAPRAPQPLQERIDLAQAGVTAEVIAVRAVETLRAAMLQSAEAERGAVPEAVRGFTRFAGPAPAAPRPRPAAVPARRASPPLVFWAGPALSLHAGAAPDWGLELGGSLGSRHLFGAVAFDTTLGDLRLEAEHGQANVRRRALWAQVGAHFRPAAAWEVATRAGAGYAVFDVAGQAQPGYHGNERAHGSPTLMLGVTTAYWATRVFALYASVGGRLATDAPSVVIAQQQVTTLDRPSFVVSIGGRLGVF